MFKPRKKDAGETKAVDDCVDLLIPKAHIFWSLSVLISK